MKKIFLSLVLGLSFSAAWAVDWNQDAEVVFLSDDGGVVGLGKVDDRKLELDVLAGFSGFVRILVGLNEVEAVINSDGTISLLGSNGLVNLRDDLAGWGLSLSVTLEDRLDGVWPQGIVVTSTHSSRDDDSDDDSGNDANRDDDVNGDDYSPDNDDDDGSGNTSRDNEDDSDDDDDDDDDNDSDDDDDDNDSDDDDDDDDDNN